MALGNIVLVGLLAMAPNWAIVDIPYPEAGGNAEAQPAPTPEAQVAEALALYARTRSLTLRKGDIAELRIDGPKATARLILPHRTETIHLELVHHEWRVVNGVRP